MQTWETSVVQNARLQLEAGFIAAFKTMPEEKIAEATNLFRELLFCLKLAEEKGSDRHLQVLLPRLLKTAAHDFDVNPSFSPEFLQLMKGP